MRLYIHSNYSTSTMILSNNADDTEQALNNEYLELLLIFLEPIQYEQNIGLNLEPIQKMNDNIRERYNHFVTKYNNKVPILNRLKSHLDQIPNDEYFFISTKDSYTAENIIFIQNLLDAYNASEDKYVRAEILKKQSKIQNLIFKEMLTKYELLVFDSEQTISIGESDREKRKCRFCGNDENSNVKATFRKKAHAFSEALGNKSIVLYEECDECNEKFGNTIEKDFITYLDFFRVFYQVKGKNGIPKLKYRNDCTIECVDGKINIKSKDIQVDERTGNCKVLLTASQKLRKVNIYKTLCKYVLSVLDEYQLQYVQETIQWISTDTQNINLPKIAIHLNNTLFSQTPTLVIYIRKNDSDTSLPHIIGDFKFKSFSFVFILPFSQKDTIDFTDKKDFEVYWNSLQHYAEHNNWIFDNFSSILAKEFHYKLNFERSQELKE